MADNDDAAASGSTSTLTTKGSGLGYILVTRHAFGDFQVGDEITDEAEIKEILSGELAVYVIKRGA